MNRNFVSFYPKSFRKRDMKFSMRQMASRGWIVFHDIKPDHVITDVKMPLKDGLAVLKGVKEAKCKDVIILTGHSDEATAIECLQSGGYDYLLKPVEDIEVLLTAVNREKLSEKCGGPYATMIRISILVLVGKR
jgi:DNA-binding response OmpR family regulator